jgi:hypothetical protein
VEHRKYAALVNREIHKKNTRSCERIQIGRYVDKTAK